MWGIGPLVKTAQPLWETFSSRMIGALLEVAMPKEKTDDPERTPPPTRPDLVAAGAWAAENAEGISERQTWIRTRGTQLADLQVLQLD
jgi:hypothetical protein